jgi:hypothetical protein
MRAIQGALERLKAQAGIGSKLAACQLGLAVPGMPFGSPGMEQGGKFDSFKVLLVKKDGTTEVFSTN